MEERVAQLGLTDDKPRPFLQGRDLLALGMEPGPAVGAVLVLRRKGASRGHLAVVTRVVNSREVVASHANWLNKGRIHVDTPIRDVSPDNDWSAVRVWYTPANVLGKSTYPAYGFIHPPTESAKRI